MLRSSYEKYDKVYQQNPYYNWVDKTNFGSLGWGADFLFFDAENNVFLKTWLPYDGEIKEEYFCE